MILVLGEGADQVNRFNNYRTRVKTRKWLGLHAIYFREIKHFSERSDRIQIHTGSGFCRWHCCFISKSLSDVTEAYLAIAAKEGLRNQHR
jgi:hypothetical protein